MEMVIIIVLKICLNSILLWYMGCQSSESGRDSFPQNKVHCVGYLDLKGTTVLENA